MTNSDQNKKARKARAQSAEYDEIAQSYKTSKQLDFRKKVEEYTLISLVGDVSGLSILDLACGEGIYSRLLKSFGAKELLGVDVSSEMIQLAKTHKGREQCEFQVGNASCLDLNREFDLVIGMYLLNYAKSSEELSQFCSTVFNHLRKGGRFIGVNDNPFNTVKHYPFYLKYGFTKHSSEDRQEGDPITYTMYNSDSSTFSFDNYYLSSNTHRRTFNEVGFTSFDWHPILLDPSESGNPFWDVFMKNPPIIGFSATK